MTKPEIKSWLSMLSPTQDGQRQEVEILLSHANEDRMSDEDREICVRAIQLLEEESSANPR